MQKFSQPYVGPTSPVGLRDPMLALRWPSLAYVGYRWPTLLLPLPLPLLVPVLLVLLCSLLLSRLVMLVWC